MPDGAYVRYSEFYWKNGVYFNSDANNPLTFTGSELVDAIQQIQLKNHMNGGKQDETKMEVAALAVLGAMLVPGCFHQQHDCRCTRNNGYF